MDRQELDTTRQILDRAEKLDIVHGERMTLLMDLEFTHKEIPLDLKGLLGANDVDFAHDICGIQANFNRETKTMDNCFCPRYAVQGGGISLYPDGPKLQLSEFPGVSKGLVADLSRWARTGAGGGDFMMAVLSNDLGRAVAKADLANRRALANIVLVIYNYLPADCHGSPENVKAWAEKGGLAGR